jgi:hypothetical protein
MFDVAACLACCCVCLCLRHTLRGLLLSFEFRNFLAPLIWGWVFCDCALSRCTCLVQSIFTANSAATAMAPESYTCKALRFVTRALFCQAIQPCSAVCSYDVPVLLIKRSCCIMMQLQKRAVLDAACSHAVVIASDHHSGDLTILLIFLFAQQAAYSAVGYIQLR